MNQVCRLSYFPLKLFKEFYTYNRMNMRNANIGLPGKVLIYKTAVNYKSLCLIAFTIAAEREWTCSFS
jgi:hypothetical protein